MKEDFNLALKSNNDSFYKGYKFDSHTHLGSIKDTSEMVSYAKKYNVQKMLGIVRSEQEKKEIEKKFPNYFIFAKFLSFKEFFENKQKEGLKAIDDAFAEEFPVVKAWFAPRWIDRIPTNWNPSSNLTTYTLDSPSLDPFFEQVEDLNLTLLLHISDPDLMYLSRYQPPSKYGTKQDHLQSFENVLKKHPKLKVICAHMAGQPEYPSNLMKLFEQFPHLYVDTGSAKWMVREFSSRMAETLTLFSRFSNRILFGTDLVAGRSDREPIPEYYIHRYDSYQLLFETNIKEVYFPIPDPDNNDETRITGLDLSREQIEKLYWKNGQKLFNFKI